MKRPLRKLQSWIGVLLLCSAAAAAEPDALLETILSVQHGGMGNVEAHRAVRELNGADAASLPTILKSLDGANPVAANWIRSVVETIADRHLQQAKPLPVQPLEEFVRDTSHNPRARRLAFELVARVDGTAADRLVPGMLNDPSPEFRRDAVARLLTQSQELMKQKKTEEAAKVYLRALSGVVDDDQIKAIVKPLRAMGHKVDLQKHFGFLTHWHMIGPFENRGDIGFDTAYPPEQGIDLSATYPGQLGDVRWMSQSTEDDYGVVDVEKLYKNYKGSVMFATTEFSSPVEQTVEFRLGITNAWKLWLNGKQIFSRHEYHRGMHLDQYRLPVTLRPGGNRILLKVCQNEQTEKWAQKYQFQFRVCDATGCAVLPKMP